MPDINDGQRGDIDVDELTPTIRQGQLQIAVGYFWFDVAGGTNFGRPQDQLQLSISGRLYEFDANGAPLDGGGVVSIDINGPLANLGLEIDAAVAAINGDGFTNVFAWNIDDLMIGVANVHNVGDAGNGLALATVNDAVAPDCYAVTGAATIGGDDAEDVAVYEGKHVVEATDVSAWGAAGPSYSPINTFEVPAGTTPTLDFMQVWTATGQMRNPELVAGGLQLTHRLVNLGNIVPASALDTYALEVWDETGTLAATDVISWQVTAR